MVKVRKVIVTLEMETSRTMKDLRSKDLWWVSGTEITQVQVNVVKPGKIKKKPTRS